MNLFMRLLWVLLRAWAGPRVAIAAPGRLAFRVWPHDLGWRDHLPNYRYCSFLELGRAQLWHGSGLALSGRYRSRLIAAQQLVYLQPLAPFQRFEVGTQLLGWDDKYCYYLQRVVCGERLMAVALVKEVCRRGGRSLSPIELLGPAPAAATVLQRWQALQQSLRELG